jgi:ribose/xylose/arabinose/galactoside ABC-type transport system permease subunit
MPVENKANPAAATDAQVSGRSRAETLALIRKVWPWVFLVLLVIFFTIASQALNDVQFLSPRSVQGILIFATQILLIGLGETYVIITGGIDLSVGFVVGLAAVVAAMVMKALHPAGIAPLPTILIALLVAVSVSAIPGLINGILVSRVKVPPFIATLGIGGVVQGVSLLLSGGYPVAQQPPYLGQLGNGYLIYLWPGQGVSFFGLPEGAVAADLQQIIPLIPNVVFATIIVTIIVWFILAKTQFGQHVYAIGGNFEAAKRSGIPTQRSIIWVYTISAVLAGIAGCLWAARFTSGASNAGEATLLTAIAAVVIGGASLFGGEGTVLGTIVGSLIVATIQFGLVILGVLPFWQFVAVGVVVIVAVIVDQFGRTIGN